MTARLTGNLKGMLLGTGLGLVIGIGGFTFVYARGASYLVNDPNACANCHIMTEQFDGWTKSSHRQAATCNDCHTPEGAFAKYFNKASNGFWHSYAFTTGRFNYPIRIKPHNYQITEDACRRCHQELTATIEAVHRPISEGGMSCIKCHRNAGHMH
ncbi:MAG: cytochrome c nitrite reductase small subunit [Acidobacteriota bacterium]|nr:cytochrome c nitrite reductase small subunit [Blastocatellia bacterium]MDW8411466.1 cytochrome c nitrite reductase small subunit [Acidobacteriota bacterium]